MMRRDSQQSVDEFYWSHGPCCAGCDWWRHFSAVVGECRRSPPVSAADRWALIGITYHSGSGAGHVATPREHHCGEFADTFNWSSLPPHYLRRIGYRPPLPKSDSTA